MPPRRPIPDVDLISVLKFFKPMDQLTASKVSPRLKLLVRAANRRVKTLVITDQDLIRTQQIINSFFISSMPNLQQLTDDRGEAIDFQPKAVRVSRWNSLMFGRDCHADLPTVEEIATLLFSAVTSIVFIANGYYRYNFAGNCNYLVELLQHLADQLESLVLGLNGNFYNKDTTASLTYELMTTLNALPALQLLAVDFSFDYEDSELPALVVLARLKVLVVKLGLGDNKAFFLHAISEQAADNVDLQIHLEDSDAYDLFQYRHTSSWSKSPYSRVVRLGVIDDRFLFGSDICPLFPSLTSLSLVVPRCKAFSTNYVPLITALSQHNRQLLHLGLTLDLVDQQNLNPISAPPPLSLPQLTSVRALTIDLRLGGHSQAELLHLPWTLPNCQAIHLRSFICYRCRVDLWKVLRGHHYTEDSEPTNFATALQCLRDVLSCIRTSSSSKSPWAKMSRTTALLPSCSPSITNSRVALLCFSIQFKIFAPLRSLAAKDGLFLEVDVELSSKLYPL